jgi:transposase
MILMLKKGSHVEGVKRDQVVFLPDRLDDYVDEGNEVRFVDAFIDTLDLVKLGLTHSIPKDVGRPAYNPVDLLKLYVWGYLNQVRSSRKLERECHRNIEVMWLMKRLAPDFKTTADFRKENVDCIRRVFKEFVYLCNELGLIGGELVAIDGSKLRAVNSIDRNLNLKTLADKLKRVDEKIQKYLKEIDENDAIEEGASSSKFGEKEKLRERVQKLREKTNLYSGLPRKLNESGENEVSLTDPDSRLMKDRGKLAVCYNAHAAVDSKEHMIVDYDVTNIAPDNVQLSPISKGAKETLGVEKLDVTADKGFFSATEIKQCVDNGIKPYILEPKKSTAGKAKSAGIPTPEFYEEKFIYDKETDTYICPAGERLDFRTWDRKQPERLVSRIYRTNACKRCPFFMTKCTKNRIHGRMIKRWEHEEILEEMKQRIKEEPNKVEVRKTLSEHPFGTIKRAFNQGYLLLKGWRKVSGEVGFTMLAYNMRRAINILGTKALLASLDT